MVQHVKYISETQISYPPKNLITEDGETICNFNTDEVLMLSYGYKPLHYAEREVGKNYIFSYEEHEDYVQEIAIELPETSEDFMTNLRREAFRSSFFQTSLGWVKRIATKANGEQADFLLDYLPIIQIAVEKGLIYPLVLYEEPDFTQPVEDWTVYQHRVPATEQFIIDCLNQVANDFLPQDSSENNGE